MVIYLLTPSWSPDVSSSYRFDLSLWRGAQMQSEHPDRLWAVSCEKILSVRGLSLFLSDHYNSVCMCTCPWDVLYSRLYKHSVPFFFKGTTEIGWLLSSPVCTFSADADVGFHGNVTRDGEWEASMVPSSNHSLESPLCFFFVNHWDVCWSPCRPCCSCSQCQAGQWLWPGTRSEITSAWLFSAAWQSHVVLFWQGMEVSRGFQKGPLKKKKGLWQLRRSFPVTFIWPAMLTQCLALLQLS